MPDLTPEEKLAQVRAERARLQAERDAKEAARSTEDLLEAESRALADEKALADAEEKHTAKRVRMVRTDMGAIIVKRPHPAIFKRFQDKGSMKTDDLDALVRPNVVYPDLGRFDQILEELPATLIRLADAIAGLAGTRGDDISGK